MQKSRHSRHFLARAGVTMAAPRLQDMGMISYARGHIKILDPVAACRRTVRNAYDFPQSSL